MYINEFTNEKWTQEEQAIKDCNKNENKLF